MKHNWGLIPLLVILLCLVGCKKEQPSIEHVIVYRIDQGAEARICISDYVEWYALLDRFCNMAKEGRMITFYNANRKSKGSVNIGTAGIVSTMRKKMKGWMIQMEYSDMIVSLSYDTSFNSWCSMTYANEPTSTNDCYKGTLVSIQREYYSDYIQYPYWGLKVNDDTVYRVVKNGSYRTTDEKITIKGYEFRYGDTVIFSGSTRLSRDFNYDLIYILDLDFNNYPDNLWKPYPIYCSESDNGTLMITLDEENNTLYCTSTYDDQEWQGKIGGGVFRYEETSQTDSLGNPIIMVYNDAMHSSGSPFSIEHRSNSDVILRDLTGTDNPYQSIYTPGSIRLYRTYTGIETWVCDTLGFNIVMHIYNDGCIPYYEGYFSSPFYAGCTTPFISGRFTNQSGFRTICYVDRNYSVISTANFEVIYTGTTLTLTPISELDGCVESYVFHQIPPSR